MSSRAATLKVDIVTNARGDGVEKTSSKLGKLGKVGKVAALGVAAAIGATAVLGKKLLDAGERAGTSNARISQVATSMGLFGKETDKVSGRLVKYAERQARATGVDQNAIKLTQAKLLTFKEVGKSADTMGGNFDRATKAAVDLGAAGFGSAENNAVQLGKALNDPIKGLSALGRSGITFTEAEKKRITTLTESNRIGQAQSLVLKAIENQVGGTAKATANGTDRMRVGFSQVAEKLGQKLTPAVDKAATWVIDKFLPGATKLGKQLSTKLGPSIASVGGFISNKLVPAGVSLYHWFVDKIVPGFVKYVTPIVAGLGRGFDKVKGAIADNEPQLRKIGNALKTVAEFVATKVMPVLGLLIGKGFEAVGIAIGLAVDGIGAFTDAVGWTIDKIKDLVGWIGKIDFPDLPSLGDLNPFSAGGVTTIAHRLAGGSPSYDGRRSWSTASAGGPTLSSSLRRLSGLTPGGTVVDARTFLSVNVDGSGIVDETKVARELAALLARWANRIGRPITELLASPTGVIL